MNKNPKELKRRIKNQENEDTNSSSADEDISDND